MLAVLAYRRSSGPAILSISVLHQVGDDDFPFNVVIQNLAGSKAGLGVVGNSNIRASIRSQNLTAAGAGNAPRQVDLATLGIDVFHHQPFRLGIVIHLDNIFVNAEGGIVFHLVSVVDFVHGATLDRHLAAVVFQLLDMPLAEDLIAVGIFFGDLNHILTIPALNQPIYVDISCRKIHAVPRNPSRLWFRDIGLGCHQAS